MSDDPVKKMNKNIAELFLRHEIERKDAAIAELTEALKRDVIDETRNAELNSAKDAAIAELTSRAISCEQRWTTERAERAEMAIAELVGALYACLPHLPPNSYYGAREIISRYDNTTTKVK